MQGLESVKTDLTLYRECTLACLIPQTFKVEALWPSISSSSTPEAKLDSRDYESVIRAEELCTPIDTTVLHEPPSSTDKNVVDFFFHAACVGIPSQLKMFNKICCHFSLYY